MVDRPRPVGLPQAPVRRRRRRPRWILYVQRLLVLGLLAGGVLGGFVLVRTAIGSGGDKGDKTKVVAPAKRLRIVFPEGFTREDMANRIVAVNRIALKKRHIDPRLAKSAYLNATDSSALPAKYANDKKLRPLEGFLFPATYDFFATTTSQQLVAEQLKAFTRNWKKVNLKYSRGKKLTPYDVLIIASMIEKEVVAPEERALVSAVIYNRLRARIPLGIDATIRYALHVPPTKSLTKKQLRDPTPYNTRLHRGLVPTPISNPGLASMQAAAHPAKKDYLYFVRKPDKVHHFFTASYAAFQEYLRKHGYPPDA
jgi:UPF0755 protein